jgi:very-short-patch-repair endonuclease
MIHRPDGPALEKEVAELASSQHGLVTRAQLLAIGVTAGAVRQRVRTERLRPVQRGVYRLGPLVSAREREMGAILACGAHAVVSHRNAAVLRLLLPQQGAPTVVEVTVRLEDRRRRPGIRVHCAPTLRPDEISAVEGIPTTTAARTLLDLAGVVTPRTLEGALARALRRELATAEQLFSLIERHPRRPGVRVLRALLEPSRALALTESRAEERFLRWVDRAQLPRPETNVELAGYVVDFLWRAERVVVEVDGFTFHSSRSQFEKDRRRDGHLSALGFHVIRVTWRQMSTEPVAMLIRLAQTLASGRPQISSPAASRSSPGL